MRSNWIRGGIILGFCLTVILGGGCGGDSLERLEQDIARVVEKAGPSVVCIMGKNETSGEIKFGSGVILDQTHILTTENILDNVNQITVKLQDGQVIEDQEISGIYCDFETNVSLMEVKGRDLKPVSMPDPGEITSGCMGIALGNTNYSKGLDVNLGTVSRSWIGGVDAYDESLMIWHGPPVSYHGGTPIFNRRGELLGLTEGVPEGEEGVVFILPASTCVRVSQVMKKEGGVQRGWIGIFCATAPQESETGRPAEGVRISRVVPDSPAYARGLSPGDRIVGFNGRSVGSPGELRKLVSSTPVGSHVLLSLVRQGEKKTVDVVVKTAENDEGGMRRCPYRSI
jgi:S1-C subfamily serine protease